MGLRIISLYDLEGLVESSDSYRACCPVHGGRNRTALVIDKTGKYPAGIGYCFVCGQNVVKVKELYDPSTSNSQMPLKSPLTSKHSQSAPVRTTKSWQIAEHQILSSLHERMSHALEMSPRACAYLESRSTPLWVAQQVGLLYLSRRVLDDPIYASHASLLYRWVDSVIFPLYQRVEDGQYLQGYIGRTLKLWSSEMDEDAHKRALDAYNCDVREWNKSLQEGQRPKREILRWIKTEPAGWFYPGAPSRVGKIAVLVEGGWDCCGILSALAQLVSMRHPVSLLIPAGSVVGLAGTAADPSLLPATVEAVLLALDDDNAGRKQMILLREDHLHAGRPTYILSGGYSSGKDWSARWRRLGVEAVHPLLMAYCYVDAWRKVPHPKHSCLILVDNLDDALALLDASNQRGLVSGGVEPDRVVVLTSNLFSRNWFLPYVRSVVFASGVGHTSADKRKEVGDDPLFRVRQAINLRTSRLRDELVQAGIRVYLCPPPVGETWSERWQKFGYEGVRELFTAYTYAREPLSEVA